MPLNWQEKQNVTYAVPTWLRDQQILHAMGRVAKRIEPQQNPRPEPVAIVGFGPSLADTWEQVRGFQCVISCSGSHKFLVERGITPTWHIEVDPRKHKVALIGQPQKDTTYLICSTCHKAVFDHLDGYDVRLWHVFDSTDEGKRLLPPGEWALTGGCDVGLRAMTIAGFLGFRDLHVFGLDGCARGDARHAAAHPNGKQKFQPCEYGGVTYHTTPAMLEAARAVFHELDVMPAVNATFYGEGMIQHMARDYTRKEPDSTANIVAFAKPELISTEYRDLNAKLHGELADYGVGGARHAPLVLRIVDKLGLKSVLDYGCGKGLLAKALEFPIWEYDPAIPEKSASPRPAELVLCTDVLEHVEPEMLRYVLDDLRRVTKRAGYFVIHMGPARKILWDGRNTHLIQRDAQWWLGELRAFFVIGKSWQKGPELHVIVGPKAKQRRAA